MKKDLSLREGRVASLVRSGRTNAAIAQLLGISIKTVQTHRAHINRKLGVRGNAQLVAALHTPGRVDALGTSLEALMDHYRGRAFAGPWW